LPDDLLGGAAAGETLLDEGGLFRQLQMALLERALECRADAPPWF
jgi:hypothetical protein